jgi:hypothetical protein
MTAGWNKQIMVTLLYVLAAGGVAWMHRIPLSYLDAWVTFASVTSIPVALLIGCCLWDRAYSQAARHVKKGLASTFFIIISVAIMGLLYAALMIPFNAAMTPTHDVRKYDFLVGKSNSPLVSHFPRPIPADAWDVRLYHNPGVLQATTIYELGYSTTPDQINALYREYTRLSTLTLTAGSEHEYIEPSDYLADDAQGPREFSEDYTLFYLDEQPPTAEKDWNHPQSHGVAISRVRSRVVFWAESG